MKRNALTLLFVLASALGFSQDFQVPAGFDPQGPTDSFAKFQPDLFKALDWLINTSPSQQPEKRKEVNGFVIGWLTGSPEVTLEIKTETLTFMEDNPQYLPIFMTGWAKYALESNDADAVKGTVAGINSTLTFYEKHKAELGKSKGLEAYAKLRDKGKLEDDVRKKLKS
jgi:hypothetical protein